MHIIKLDTAVARAQQFLLRLAGSFFSVTADAVASVVTVFLFYDPQKRENAHNTARHAERKSHSPNLAIMINFTFNG